MPSIGCGYSIDLLEREAVPHLGAEGGVVVEEEFGEAVGADQNQIGVVLLGVVGVFGEYA